MQNLHGKRRENSDREAKQIMRQQSGPIWGQGRVGLGRSLGWGFSLALQLQPGMAQPQPQPPEIPVNTPAAVRTVLSTPQSEPVATAATPSQGGLTVPSLWWTEEQFGNQVVSNWVAYPRNPNGASRVDLFVRSDLWGRYDYLRRYSLVNHFGITASDYGYNLLVFDRQNILLAAYTCNFAQIAPNYLVGLQDFRGNPIPDYVPEKTIPNLSCQVWLNPFYPTVFLQSLGQV